MSSMNTEEWAEKYAFDGCVDLWVEEEFNAGSRIVVGTEISQTALLRNYEREGTQTRREAQGAQLGNRLQGGRDAYNGQQAGTGSGEGPSRGNVPSHRIKILNHHTDQELEVDVPEDRSAFSQSAFQMHECT